MNNLRIGWVEYINALPLNLPFQLGQIKCNAQHVYAIPVKLNHLLREGQLDIALTSSVEYFEGCYEMLPGYGIAAHHRILSVNFYTQLPTASLNGMRVGLTHHSATSVALLKIVCTYLWKVQPRFELLNREEPFSNYSALLLIGDEALTHLSIPHFQTIDMASAWYELTALPFVFAVFACQPGSKTTFATTLEEALRWSASHRPLIESEAHKRSSLPPALLHLYFNLLKHQLGKKEMEGLECFNKLRLEIAHVPSIIT
jgi:predicted solute-binding protein